VGCCCFGWEGWVFGLIFLDCEGGRKEGGCGDGGLWCGLEVRKVCEVWICEECINED